MTQVFQVFSENNHYQRFEVLKSNRNKRHKYKEFIVEGVRNINQAVAKDWEIKAFIYSQERVLSDWARGHLRNSAASAHYELTNSLMDKLSDKEESSELIAIVEMPQEDLTRIPTNESLLVMVFDRPSNRGNLGTIIRSCDALNCQGLIITGHAVDLYDPETIRSTTGSFFALPTVILPSHSELMIWIKSLKERYDRIQIIGTSALATAQIDQCDFSKPTILLIGNETSGLSFKYKEICDELVSIPISGSASSLNVANAASIVLYEVSRQRKLGNS